MSKFNASCIITSMLIALSFAGTNVLAAAPSDSTKDLSSFQCKDMMRLSGEDRQIALALVHGYALGKKGTTQYDVERLSQITDQFVDYCLDHPAENALKSFDKMAQ